MNKKLKKVFKWLGIIILVILAAYGAYKIYDYAVEVATQRIKKGAEEGVSRGIGNILNPFRWFRRK